MLNSRKLEYSSNTTNISIVRLFDCYSRYALQTESTVESNFAKLQNSEFPFQWMNFAIMHCSFDFFLLFSLAKVEESDSWGPIPTYVLAIQIPILIFTLKIGLEELQTAAKLLLFGFLGVFCTVHVRYSFPEFWRLMPIQEFCIRWV